MLDFGDTIQVFSTCPQSKDFPARDYVDQASRVAAWSDEAGCTGMLIYTDNSIVDPWLVSQIVLQQTRRLAPLVAVQPVYMLPYTAAKMAASFAFMHGRRIWLNMLAGGFKNDLVALGDETPHDDRYARTIEYALIMRRLLESPDPVSFAGRFYNVRGLRMTPPVPPELFPGFLISGSSPAGRAAAVEIGATSVEYPAAPAEAVAPVAGPVPARRGVRIGIIARADAEQAWNLAWARFPEDRRGRLAHELAVKTSDSHWHKQLSDAARRPPDGSPYWLWPFEHHKTFCPYLVGDYDTVGREIARYLALGHSTFILDIPQGPEDLTTAGHAFRAALRQAEPLRQSVAEGVA